MLKSIVGVSLITVVMGWAATMTMPAATINPDEATLRLLPTEANAVAFIDVAALRNSPLVQDALAKDILGTAFNRELEEFIASTGFDPQRDLDTVTIAKIGQKQALVIAQARYDRIRIEQYVKDQKGGRISSEAYLGRTLYTEGDKSFSFIDNLVILGESTGVKKVIDQMSLPGSMPLRSDLMDQIRAIEAGSQVWAVGDFSVKDLPRSLRGPASAMDMMKALRSGTYQMRVDRDIHAKAIGTFDDADSARNLSDTARGFIALAKLQLGKQQDLIQLLNGIQITSSGLTVMVNIEEPGYLLDKLQDLKKN